MGYGKFCADDAEQQMDKLIALSLVLAREIITHSIHIAVACFMADVRLQI